jgi:putative ABC transport system permease protein
VLTVTLRDLQFRWRQFAIAIVGTALVFALALVLTGVSAGFRTEAEDTVGAVGADSWIVPRGVTGPFTSVSALPSDLASTLRGREGLTAAEPLVALPHTVRRRGELVSVNVIGHVPGSLGMARPDEGRAVARAGDAVVDDGLDVGIRSSFGIAGLRFRVVGSVRDRTYLGGVPVVYLSLRDAQRLAFDGRRLANAIVVTGKPRQLPGQLTLLSNGEVEDDMLRPLEGARDAIDTLRILMWIVAAVIIGAVTYLSALERLRDFAVLKALGGESRTIAFGLMVQAVIASLLAAAIAVGLSEALRPAFPLPITISAGAYVVLGIIAAVVGVIASLAALRRALKVDPALAFAG